MKDRREEGFILLDLLVSFPLVTLLLTALAGLSFFAARSAFMLYADMELKQEVQGAFIRIVSDASSAYSIRPFSLGHEHGVAFRKRSPALQDSASIEGAAYFVHEAQRKRRLVYQDERQPITGDSQFAGVAITEFSWREISPLLQEFRLTGKSLVTGHSYSLATRVYGLRQEGGATP